MSSALNTPFPTSNIRTAHPPATTTTTATTTASSASHQPFTSSMRDRQARGKDPYEDSASEMDLDMAEMDLDFEPDLDLFDPSSDDFVGGLVRTPRHLHPNQSSDDSYLRRKVGRGVAAAAAAATASSSSPAAAAANLRRGRPPGESWESWRRREWARDVLETPELLMWYASSRDDSIPGTRLYFTRLLCGYEDDHSATQHHHDPPTTPRKNSSGSGRPSAHRRR
ncbi:hypothetical protein SODALDRAFT_392715 [Sodiomyces alkalinus F11]|uniref:Uncharacterized protein n=1 Tax=Sodiomyces alkalinus (strain CBS 110278 / VKM F-3762 / F11) TaxID=1314773 RepID=A0A3N2Q949_SODAK|nr:hypothetical protein SODALDRAFT_392715 [Sodiomyces alkalinus F11]ROT43282.1 hypothetical protein SODALDRAFT_392715 [Sodiomyces alkalinus F11]